MPTFIKDKNNTSKMMFHILVALIPIIVFSFYKNGVMPYLNGYVDIYGMFYPIILILISIFSNFLFEMIYQLIFNKNISIKNFIGDLNLYMSGLFLGLILPINTPIHIAIIGNLFSIVIRKILYKAFHKNIFNQALIGKLLIVSIFYSIIIEAGGYMNSMEMNNISNIVSPYNIVTSGFGTYNVLVAPYGNLFDFFIGTIPGALGETSVILCILAFIYLTLTKTIKWRIPVFYISTVFFISFILALYNNLGAWYPLFQIFSGGLMFGAIFLATDLTTSPITKSGQVIYGIGLGFLTVLFRIFSQYTEVVLASILIMNILVSRIDFTSAESRFKKSRIVIPFIILILLLILTTLMLIK